MVVEDIAAVVAISPQEEEAKDVEVPAGVISEVVAAPVVEVRNNKGGVGYCRLFESSFSPPQHLQSVFSTCDFLATVMSVVCIRR